MWSFVLICMAVLGRSFDCALQLNDYVAREGRAELQRLQGFAAQPRYGACWSRALETIQTSCQEFTEETQSKLALAFAHCHLRRSDRPFPECTDNSKVWECTRDMDPIAFNTYTEFFTHAHSICHYLQSESWQQRADNTIHRLTESSAGVAEQLASTQRIAEDLVVVQGAALRTQEAILRNGEELKHTLHDSTQGVKEVFSQIQDSAREQQLAFSEIFSRVAFLQSFVMSESHTLSSLLYNTLGLCASFLLTSTRRTAGARLVLFGLVAVNVYLERTICRTVLESVNPGYQQMERIELLVGLLRRAMLLLGLLVLVYSAVRFRDVRLESLEILARLKETQSNLHEALQRAESLTGAVDMVQRMQGRVECVKGEIRRTQKENVTVDRVVHELSVILAPGHSHARSVPERPSLSDVADTYLGDSGIGLPHGGTGLAHAAVEIPKKRGRRRSSGYQPSPSSTLVYSVLVEDTQPRYNLRSRRSLSSSMMDRLPEAPLLEIQD
ncbi:uncharacterized protein LOC133139419 [Conger conger]|uniref:uncharacterized protein LOC133139419 n=1 Tax=Conger conger TaxID=82655 RepID=UPI002A5A2B53|nr:uncharacterized protein LOC133139419 [Conger conger]XP_061114930.1 uncharacterized protein LOC133139419 [Conger conger]XP_061114931.1 uncharacterized protein LOC133139419 [Conger conger]